MRFWCVTAVLFLLSLCPVAQAAGANPPGSVDIQQQAQQVLQNAQTALNEEDARFEAEKSAEEERYAAAVAKLKTDGAESSAFLSLRRDHLKRVSAEKSRHARAVKTTRAQAQKTLAQLNQQYRFAVSREQYLFQQQLGQAQYANTLAWIAMMQRAYAVPCWNNYAYPPRYVIPVPGGYVVRRGPGWWQYPVYPNPWCP